MTGMEILKKLHLREEIYNGPGELIWDNAGKMQKNGQRPISLAKLRNLMNFVRKEQMIPRII